VLGQHTLRLIWAEMQDITLPSEVSRAPSKAGAPGSGTLSADEWRTFCTINLVVTLGWAWGTLPSGRREYALFRNFMDLVTAVKLATARSVTEQSLWEMQTAMHRYLTKLLELFPGTTISPYQHMCLGHLPMVLKTLGPAHAIWCFVFERANFIMQRIKTNSRIEDLSVTLLNRFCTRQNLRALFSRLTLPQALHKIIPTYLKTFESDTRGTLNDVLSFDSKTDATLDSGEDEDADKKTRPHALTQDVIEALHTRVGQASRRAISLKSVEYLGARYRPHATSRNDSIVVFRIGGDTEWRAGRIREILAQEAVGTETTTGPREWRTWIIVEEYRSLDPHHREFDPYRDFPMAGGRLFYSAFMPKLLALTVRDIVCHAATINRVLPGPGDRCVHILPLDKVRFNLTSMDEEAHSRLCQW
ncbi:uncharacterized protein B0H18DRAFT_875082, partial [Fomitopsis serialis]|uniref:uncharacterized protein n=1 Tax=Fomitopsis serialis TaxID=139415 RepID=UPI002008DA02